MRLKLKNVGMVSDADINIDGITVIAGANNTGKSTVGRALFSLFTGLHYVDERIISEKIQSLYKCVSKIFDIPELFLRGRRYGINEYFEDIVSMSTDELQLSLKARLKELSSVIVSKQESRLDNSSIDFEALHNEVSKILEYDDITILKAALTKNFQIEFNENVNNVFNDNPAEIELIIKGKPIKVMILDNVVEELKYNHSLVKNVVYIDNPFVLDRSMPFSPSNVSRYILDHHEDLQYKLHNIVNNESVITEMMTKEKLSDIIKIVDGVCEGEIVIKDRFDVKFELGKKKSINFGSVSAGLKTFAILKRLLVNQVLEERGTIILDEPEIHLHPEWQLVFAELIVLIQKYFNMHILITTHSPYFLNAIEVYSGLHGVSNRCSYYHASSEGENSTIIDVTDNTEAIYKQLAKPLQHLENLNYQSDL